MANIGENFKSFLEKEATLNEAGNTAQLTKAKLEEFYSANGITREMSKKFSEVTSEVDTGAHRYITEKLADKLNELKKDGKDINNEKVEFTVKMTTPMGATAHTGVAKRVSANPQDRTKEIVKYDVRRNKISLTRVVDKVAITEGEELIRKIYED